MLTASQVNVQLVGWHEQGLSKSEIIVRLAEACIGWPYVFGAVGEQCTPSTRRKYCNNYKTRNPAESEQIRKTCRVLASGVSTCNGCKFYPGGDVRCYDCRGFTRWILSRVGISLQGGGATSQWNNPLNWDFRGTIDQYTGGVAIFFQRDAKKANVMAHTGLLIGGGQIIHCSGTVKKEALYKKITHFAIPKGLAGEAPMPTPSTTKPTLRKGSRGEYVTLLQTQLIQQGYSVGSSGADGIYGNDTLYTVKKYQLDHGLQMDGIVGSATWAALEDPQPMPTYIVHIPGQAKYAAEALVKQYDGAWMTEEGVSS